MRVLLLVCVLLTSLGFLCSAFGSNGPISVVEINSNRATSPVSESSALVEATNFTGISDFATSPELVEYEDRAALGPRQTGHGWLVRGVVQVFNDKKDISQAFNINAIVDAVSGRLHAVYSDPSSNWQVPAYPEDSIERVASEAGWSMGEDIPVSMQSNVADVLATIWSEYGLSPAEVGQVIIRPRWITPQYPARRVGDSLVPIRPTEKVWIVQICGVKMEENRDGYFTQRFIQLHDGTLDFAWSFYLP